MKKRETLYSKAAGAMIGLAVGDAVGDLGRDQEIRQRYGIVTQLLPEGRSTDDTEFAVLTARSLLDAQGKLTHHSLYTTWKRLILDRGGAQKRGGDPLYGAIWNLNEGILPPKSGLHNTMNNDDGAAMRSAPCGIVAAGNPKEAARLAELDASVSHKEDGIWAAQAVAASIAVALTGESVDKIIKAALPFIPQESWLGERMSLALSIIEENELFEAYHLLHTKIWGPRHSIAAEAVPQAYALFKLSGGDFMKGLLLSANFGRDADTISALVLALCGAKSGLDAIPQPWIDQVKTPAGVCLSFTKEEDMLTLSQQLVDLAEELSKK